MRRSYHVFVNARRWMFRLPMAWAACLGICGLAAIGHAESSPAKTAVLVPAPLNPAVGDLVQQLGDPSFAKRNEASEKLRIMVADGLRATLLDAAHHSFNPEIRQRAAKLLCSLSWTRPDDDETVRRLLGDYRTPLVEKRMEVLPRLGALGPVAAPALIRLLAEDPSDDVRWAIVAQLRALEEGARARLRETRPSDDDAPALAAAGWGWQSSDPERAAPMFRRSVDIASTQPVDDHGEVDALLQLLMARAVNRAEYADAVELYRRQIWYSELPAEQVATNLFALYALYGPQPGFERDVRIFDRYFSQPEMMYVIGRMYDQHGNRLAAEACYTAAAAATIGDPDAHLRVGEFLLVRQWFELARPELSRAIGGASGTAQRDIIAYYNLARCADGMGDDLLAADDLDKAVKEIRFMAANGGTEPIAMQYTALADWHRLRDAAQKENRPELARLSAKLMASRAYRLDEASAVDVDIDLARALKTLGRPDESKQVFEQAYPQLRAMLDQRRHDPEALNNLAWLCSRSGEHLEEAYRWSSEAIRLAPGNAAYLDTAAEAAAAIGKFDEAVQRESTALAMQPGDRFMTRQLARFTAAARGKNK